MANKRKKPYFMSQDYFRYKKLGRRWRKPRGLQSKLRIKKGGSGKLPRLGFSAEKSIRNLVKVGSEYLNPVIIRNEKDLDVLKKGEVAVLSGSIGARKVLLIKEKAAEKKIRFLYTKRFSTAAATKKMIAKRKEEKKKEEHKKHESHKKHEKEDKKETIAMKEGISRKEPVNKENVAEKEPVNKEATVTEKEPEKEGV